MKPKNTKKKNNEELVKEYQSETDPVKKKKIADQLFRKIYRLVLKNAGNMPSASYGGQEDLIQEASLVFMKCINKFDTTRNIKFSTYFSDACKYEINRFKKNIRKHVDNNYFLEIDEIITAKPSNLDDQIDDENNLEKIQNALLKLNKEQKITNKQFNTIIEEHGFFGAKKKTRKQMSLERNCSLQNIGFLYRKAVDRIREELGIEE